MSKFSKWLGDRWGDGPSMSGLQSSIKGTGHFAGNVAQYAAPLVSVANPLLGAGIAAASAGLRGKSVADMVKDAAIVGGTGYALGHAGDVLNRAKGFFGSAEPAAGAAGDLASSAGSSAGTSAATAVKAASAPAGGWSVPDAALGVTKSVGRHAVDYISNHPGDVLSTAGHAAGAVLNASAENARTSLERRRLENEEAQIRRQNQFEDAQNRALNPARQALLEQMMRRLGLSPQFTAVG